MKLLKIIFTIVQIAIYTNLIYADELYSDKYVAKFELIFSQPNFWDQLIQNKESEIDIAASLIFNDTLFFDSVGVRFKGNSSYNIPNDKKSFNISLDTFKDEYRLFGYKTLNLNNCFVDPTFVREKLSNKIFSEYMPAPATGFARLYINGKYWGLYSNVEQINKIFIAKWFPSNDGNMYKGDPKGNLIWRGDNQNLYKKDYEKKTNEKEDDWADLVQLIGIINNSKYLIDELPTVLNIDRAIWYLALCNILVNLDSYIFSGHNYYIYNDPTTQQFNILNWDLNESFGVFPPQLSNKERFEVINNKNPNLPLLNAIFKEPYFREVYLAHYRTILKNNFKVEYIMPRINEFQNLIDEFVMSDTMKLYSYSDFKKNISEDVFVQGRLVPGLSSFIENRRQYLFGLFDITKEIPLLTNLKISNENPMTEDMIAFTVKSENSSKIKNVFLVFRIGQEKFIKLKMLDDGKNRDSLENDGIYGIQFLVPKGSEGDTIYYYSLAENHSGTLKFEPEGAEFKLYKAAIRCRSEINKLVLNEFMADNKNTIMNEEGKYADWIELYNPNNYDIELGGMYLTDDSLKSTKWMFPDTTISAKNYMLIWADESKSTNGLHSNFKLSKDGEFIGLYSNEETGNILIDKYIYDKQKEDISEGRFPNGIGDFLIMNTPTPNKENIYSTNIENTFLLNSDIKIYPNPASDYLIINSIIDLDIENKFKLLDILGNSIEEIKVTRLNSRIIMIDVSKIGSGTYIIELKSNIQNTNCFLHIIK